MIHAKDVRTVEDAIAIVEGRGLTHVKVGVFDIDGVLRGKYMEKRKFLKALEQGFGFCDVVLGWDLKDQLYDNARFTGWHTGYPDARVKILPHTCREVLDEDNTLLFLAEFCDQAEEVCPRGCLRRVLARAQALGFEVKAALEYEFFLFDETPDSVREKGFQHLNPMTPDWFGYSMLRNSVHAELYQDILAMADKMDFAIEGLHTETGPGVLEAAIGVDNALEAADKAALFKTYMKVLAQRHGLMATFMAKWSMDYPGQSGHIHVSLVNKNDGSPVFYDPANEHGMSEAQRQFIAGQEKLMPELLAMIAPTINSYTRLVPGYWAPTHANWGVENRTTALRVITGSENAQRVEYRVAAADANPYLALAGAIGSGLLGIENQWQPNAQTRGNAYEQEYADALALPSELWGATQAFKHSESATRLFGAPFVAHFSATREWEVREFQRHVTNWEMQRYFEII